MTRKGKPAEYRMKVALSNIGSMCIELIEPLIQTTLELIERPKRRNPPEKIYPEPD